MNEIFKRMQKIKIIPVVKIEDVEDAIPLAEALCRGGLPAAEITFRTDAAQEAIRMIAAKIPDMLIGAGTVLTLEQVDQAVSAGAQFIVSPGFNPKVVQHCLEIGIPVIPGCATPSDMEKAIEMGLDTVKFFPAEAAGGLNMIKAMSAPYHQMMFMPTGGINVHNVKKYLDFPKVLACGGSWMVSGELLKKKDFTAIEMLCAEAKKEIFTEKEKPDPQSICFECLDKNKPFDLISFGEIMLRLTPENREKLAFSSTFSKHAGGAELNVSAGMSQLGLHCAIISKLPQNEIGHFIRNQIKMLGVDDRYLLKDSSPDGRVGIYFYEQGISPKKPSVVYDRKHSSIHTISISEIDDSIYHSTKLFHVSGISLAVGSAVRKTAVELIKRFKKGGAMISFDVNYRANLWSEQEARAAIEEILPWVDILFVSEETSRKMFQKTGTLREMMKSYCCEYGVSVVASTERKAVSPTNHTFGSTVYSHKDEIYYTEQPYKDIEVVDRIGSGDAFVAGALYGLLTQGCEKAVSFGNAMAAMKNTVYGDMAQTDLSEIERIIKAHSGQGGNSEMNR